MPDTNPGLMTIFGEALEQADPATRAAYLEHACGTNADLRQRVEALLAAHAGAGRFLEAASPDTTGAFDPEAQQHAETATGNFGDAPTKRGHSTATAIGTVIADRYTLIEVIGEGGMGSVYLASQTEPVKRQVALKLIKSGMDTKAVLARFDAERQALALMDHPNIARIYDGGVTSGEPGGVSPGSPFFVMELVKGVPLTDYCDTHRLSVDARLQLFVSVCNAVQHAHQKGIIHRDLKPSNVLVTEVDGRPTPKVIDFGVAKATELKLTDMSFADTGAIVGTPAYMSPEQADPSSMDIDTRTDVYALGVMLYELLTGSPPIDSKQFKRGAVLEMLRMVREVEPPRPSTRLSSANARPNIAANRSIEPAKLAKLLEGELDWVVMKSLEKDRTRRYDTANGLALDIQRYLADEVVEARPPSTGYRLKKFVRRNKGQVIAASLVLFVLIGGIVGTTRGLFEARRQQQLARDETTEKEQARAAEAERVKERDAALKAEGERAAELKHRLGVSDMVLASAAFDKRDVALVAERLDRVPPEQRGWEWHYLKQQAHGGIFTLYGHTGPVTCAAFSPDGKRIVTGGGSPPGLLEARVWDARTGELQLELLGHTPMGSVFNMPLTSVSFSPDGKSILTAGGLTPATLWDAQTGHVLFELNEKKSTSAAFNPEGTRIVTGGADGPTKAWDARTGARLFDLGGQSNTVAHVAFSPDGTRLATCGYGKPTRMWDARKGGEALFEVKGKADCLAFSPDGTRFATGSGGSVRIWDARDGQAAGPEIKHRTERTSREFTSGFNGVLAVAFSPDGGRIVTGGGEGKHAEARVWDARTGAELLEMTGHQRLVNSVAFSPDGTRIVTGSSDGTVKVWDARVGTSRLELVGHNRQVNGLALSPDGARVVTVGGPSLGEMTGPGGATVWDARTGRSLVALKGHVEGVSCVAFSPDGTRIVTGGTRDFSSGEVKVWDSRTGALLFEWNGFKEGVQSVAFSPDGSRIVTGGANEDNMTGTEVKVWDAQQGTLLLDLTHSYAPLGYPPIIGPRGWRVAFSPDGTRLLAAAGGPSATAKVWDVRTGKVAVELKGVSGFVQGVAFSPDGDRIVTGGDATATVWDARTGAAVLVLKGHTGDVNGLAFSPDGTRVVTGSGDRTLRVWDARTGTSLIELNGHVGYITAVAFSQDGIRVVAGGRGWAGKMGQAMVWDVPTGKAAPALNGHTNQITGVSFSPDGTRVVTSSIDRTVKVWDVPTGSVTLELKGFQGGVGDVCFGPDGKRIVTVRLLHTPDGGSEVKVWDVATGAELLDLKGYKGEARRATFSSDGAQIVLSGYDRTTRVWDAGTGREVPGAPVPKTVSTARVSPDGKLFAYADTNHSVRLVPFRPDAGELANRLLRTEPDVGRYLEGYRAARVAKDDFAVKYYVKLIPEDRRTALIAKAEMDVLEILAAQHLRGGNWDQGLPLLVELLNLKKANLGPEDPDTIETMNQLGGLFRQIRRFDEAVPLFEKLVKVREARLGRTHRDTLDSIRNLGLSHRDGGRAKEAIPLLEEVQRATKRDQSVANELVDAYTQAGEHAGAVKLLQERLAETRKSQPGDDSALIDILARLGVIYLEQKNWAAAEPLLREQWAACEKQQPDDWNTFNVRSMLGGALLGQKKYADAEPLLVKGYEGLKAREKAIPPQGNIRLPEALDRLIELYTATGKPDEAKKWRAERAKYPALVEKGPMPREVN